MNDRSLVGVHECPADLNQDIQRLLNRKPTGLVQPVPGASLQSFHDDKEGAKPFLDVEHLDDVFVAETG
jgi:hypothetical protein